MNLERIECTITSWESALKVFRMFNEHWIFRGHADERWELQTSLERYAYIPGPHRDSIKAEGEKEMLRGIQSQAHFRLGATSREMTSVDWLALLQHHGGVTRLLDFTKSIYVALFFALEGASDDQNGPASAVWALDRRPFRRQMEKLALAAESALGTRDILSYVNHLIDNSRSEYGFAVIEPNISSERLTIQQGLFLMNLSYGGSFEDVVSKLYPIYQSPSVSKHHPTSDELFEFLCQAPAKEKPPVSLKFIIPAKLRLEMLAELRSMNVTSATLFPGLDGFARSLNFLATGYSRIAQHDTMD